MTVPGSKPKFGTVKIGHADVHQGNGMKSAVLDDYPLKYGLLSRPRPESAKEPRRRKSLWGGEVDAIPSKSVAQQHYFGAIKGGSIPKPKGMSDKVVDEFARTSTAGLPKHVSTKADGKMATNTMFQQKESTGKKRPDWMERAVPHMADGSIPEGPPDDSNEGTSDPNDPGEGLSGPAGRAPRPQPRRSPVPPGQVMAADGRRPASGIPYRVKKTVVDAVTPPPRARKYFGQPEAPAMMADGKKPDSGHWMEEAFSKNVGGLHRATSTPAGEKIPAGKMAAALHSDNLHVKSYGFGWPRNK